MISEVSLCWWPEYLGWFSWHLGDSWVPPFIYGGPLPVPRSLRFHVFPSSSFLFSTHLSSLQGVYPILPTLAGHPWLKPDHIQSDSQTTHSLTRSGGSSWLLRDRRPGWRAGLRGLKEGLRAGGHAGGASGPTAPIHSGFSFGILFWCSQTKAGLWKTWLQFRH